MLSSLFAAKNFDQLFPIPWPKSENSQKEEHSQGAIPPRQNLLPKHQPFKVHEWACWSVRPGTLLARLDVLSVTMIGTCVTCDDKKNICFIFASWRLNSVWNFMVKLYLKVAPQQKELECSAVFQIISSSHQQKFFF